MPLTIIVVTVRRDMMTMSEMKTNDTMQMTTSSTNDANECVLARTCSSHAPSRMRSHDAKRVAPEQLKRKYTRHVHHPHAVHATRTIIVVAVRVQRHEDNERDEDERQDEEDQGHDGRRERVRAARARGSHAPRHMRKHAADRVASTSAKQEPSPRPDGLSKTNARHVATVGGRSP